MQDFFVSVREKGEREREKERGGWKGGDNEREKETWSVYTQAYKLSSASENIAGEDSEKADDPNRSWMVDIDGGAISGTLVDDDPPPTAIVGEIISLKMFESMTYDV